ncbi:MAG: DPP IV N-terminal domain-containing protein [Pyrinomonadaceae bacterium]
MKRCPECRRDYYDETLLYCLDDGTGLVDGPSSGSGDLRTAILSGDNFPEGATTRPLLSATDVGTGPDTAGSPNPAARRSWAPLTAIAAVIAVAAGLGFIVFKYRATTETAPLSIKLEKVTTQGKTSAAAISPDGKYAVYNVDEGGAQSLWTKQIATSSNVQIIPPAQGVEYSSIRFSPDGNFVTFRRRDRATNVVAAFQMPALGGAQKKIAHDVDSAVTYSPDGKSIAYLRGNSPEMGESVLLIANTDGTGERILAKRKRPETFPWWAADGAVAWAPSGRTIAAVIGGNATGSGEMQVVEVDVSDGSQRQITKQGWYEISHLSWLPDGSGLLVMGAEKASDYYTQQLTLVSYPSGESHRITADFNNYRSVDLTADGKTLAVVQSTRLSNIWIVPNADASRAFQIKTGGPNQEGTDGLAWSPDGRIVFYSKASGSDDIWIMKGDGSDVKQLTVDAGTNYSVRVTPDGKYIIFTSERAGHPNIWRMDTDGANPKQLTFGTSEFSANVTPDSKWVFFDSTASGTPAIWKVSIERGDPVQVTTRFTEIPEVSPDGKYLACSFRENAIASWRYAIFSVDGGEPLKVLDLPPHAGNLRWTPDGRSLSVVKTTAGVDNIWSTPVDGGPSKQLTQFKNDYIFNFRWSPDGKGLVMARGSVISDVVLIRDFR